MGRARGVDESPSPLERDPPHPHCDDLVLHAPGECWACDLFPDRQAQRLQARVNFTGQDLPDRDTCPSTRRRSLEDIEKWPRNRAQGGERG